MTKTYLIQPFLLTLTCALFVSSTATAATEKTFSSDVYVAVQITHSELAKNSGGTDANATLTAKKLMPKIAGSYLISESHVWQTAPKQGSQKSLARRSSSVRLVIRQSAARKLNKYLSQNGFAKAKYYETGLPVKLKIGPKGNAHSAAVTIPLDYYDVPASGKGLTMTLTTKDLVSSTFPGAKEALQLQRKLGTTKVSITREPGIAIKKQTSFFQALFQSPARNAHRVRRAPQRVTGKARPSRLDRAKGTRVKVARIR